MVTEHDPPDRFKILEEIQRDPVSIVHRAFDRKLHREVVLKRLRSSVVKDRKFTARMIREARAIAQVRSPFVLSVWEVGEDPLGPYICIEPARGESLKTRIERCGPLEADEAARVGRELCEALAATHRASILHRNLDIDQVFLDAQGRVALTGFALAHAPSGKSSTGTTVGQTSLFWGGHLGNRLYAPEQSHGGELDARSDLFALAMVLYQCLLGRPVQLSSAQGKDWPSVDKLQKRRPDLPSYLIEALGKALQFFPAQRFQSASDFAAALQPAVASAAPPERAAAPAGSGHRSRVVLLATTAVTVVVVLCVGLWIGGVFDDATPSAAESSRALTAVKDISPTADLQPGYTGSHALVIGINDYRDDSFADLMCAESDARAIHDFLVEEEGFPEKTVTLLLGSDATRDAILRHLETELPARAGRNDRVLIYFAGHGQQKRAPGSKTRTHAGWIVPYDGTQDISTSIGHAQIRASFDLLRAKHILMLLDCCFSGWATRGGGPASPLYEEVTRDEAIQILTAGKPGQVVADGLETTAGHSPFTYFLLDGLRSSRDKSFVTFSDLALRVRRGVNELTDGYQTPVAERLRGGGDFVFEFRGN